jgi:hypothetical protein
MEHHATLSPSSLPMLDRCQLFERGMSDETYQEDGNRMHTAFANLLRGQNSGVVLSLPEAEGVQWAVDYVKMTATSEYPIEVEQKLTLVDDRFRVITFGTADALNGRAPWMADLKTMDEHDYYLQMACYAVMKMQRDGGEVVEVDVLYSRDRRVVRYVIGRMEATERLAVLFAKIRNPHREPNPNEFCKWCKHLATCEAVAERVTTVATAHDWLPVKLSPTEIINPIDMGKALSLARLFSDWCEEIERRGKEMDAAGVEIPGWRRRTRAGARSIKNVPRAFELSGLPPEAFYSALSISVGAVEEAIAKVEGIPLKAAKAETNTRLAEVLEQRPPSVWLEPTK